MGPTTTTDAQPVIASCSFCRRTDDEVVRLVAGPGVFICDACVTLASDIVAGEATTRPGVAPWDVEMPLETVLELLEPVAAAEAQAERNLGLWVAKARGLGATWARIGQALGITRQSAWGRFSGEG